MRRNQLKFSYLLLVCNWNYLRSSGEMPSRDSSSMKHCTASELQLRPYITVTRTVSSVFDPIINIKKKKYIYSSLSTMQWLMFKTLWNGNLLIVYSRCIWLLRAFVRKELHDVTVNLFFCTIFYVKFAKQYEGRCNGITEFFTSQ